MNQQQIVQVAYIKAPIEQVWEALTNPDITQRYWGNTRIQSDWQTGSKIQYMRGGEITDEHIILEIDKPRKLVHTFQPLFDEFKNESPSRVSISLIQGGEVVRLTLEHDNFPPNSKVYLACREGWPMLLSGLKTLLETGKPLPEFTAES